MLIQSPSNPPSPKPSPSPSLSPSQSPSKQPTPSPTQPTTVASPAPTNQQTTQPSTLPTTQPSLVSTPPPSTLPTTQPFLVATSLPSQVSGSNRCYLAIHCDSSSTLIFSCLICCIIDRRLAPSHRLFLRLALLTLQPRNRVHRSQVDLHWCLPLCQLP